ncbi:MAG: hypothetical protein HPY76_12345 [Anaerolineae bacterium]|nr:hypothetical protein [Anaerolineae bacterium]
MDAPYIGGDSPPTLPLARYLPLQPAGIFSHWLHDNVPAGALVLDPLGTHPLTAIEAAQAGYRVIVCCNNPILVFMLEMLASAPDREELLAALAELAAARRNSTRLEQQLLELYLTECPNCNALVPADAYIWQKGAEFPSARLLHCPHCETEGEFNVTPGDIARYAHIGNDTLHRARALQRVSVVGDEYYENALAALDVYAKRPLYVIFTLLNKIDSLSAPERTKQLLYALLLPVLDQGNTLWLHPAQRVRPRQLSTPPLIRENNLWLALENAIDLWTVLDKRVAVSRWQTLPEPGGISILSGRLRSLFPLPAETEPRAVVTVLPRPGQAFWTLSALWCGWLWGREAVTPLRSALQRLRYDWNWHARALKTTFSTLAEHLPAQTPMFACAPEAEPGFLTAAMVAASLAKFHVHTVALQEEANHAQINWQHGTHKKVDAATLQAQMRKNMGQHLAQRGEPAPFMTLLTAALAPVDFSGTSSGEPGGLPHNFIGQVQTSFRAILSAPQFMPSDASQAHNPESTNWYSPHLNMSGQTPRFDRMERALVQFLLEHEVVSLREIEMALFAALPGLNTPKPSEIELLLGSYAEAHTRMNGWRIQEREQPTTRRQDIRSAIADLTGLGERLGYRVQGEMPLLWLDSAGGTDHSFHILASSIVSSVVYQTPADTASQRVIVLPGSRCNLLSYKLKEDPLLAKAFEEWHTLKFRHLRSIAKRDELTLDTWKQLLDADPPSWEEATQFSIFPEAGDLPLFPAI